LFCFIFVKLFLFSAFSNVKVDANTIKQHSSKNVEGSRKGANLSFLFFVALRENFRPELYQHYFNLLSARITKA